jgi:hypothetical protein
MTLLGNISGVTGKDIAVHQGFFGGLVVFEIPGKIPRAFVQYLSVFIYLDIHPGHRGSNGFRIYVAVFLDRYQGTAFGHAVKLLEVDPQGPEKFENFGPDGFPGGISHPHVFHTEIIGQRAVNQKSTDLI